MHSIYSEVVRGNAVELCCGMGGIGIGLAASGYQVVKAYDSWQPAVGIYNHNAQQNIASLCDILSDAGFNMIKRDKPAFKELELLAAGPPCKGFSQIRNGHHQPSPHNRVLSVLPQYIGLLRPRLVLIENVPDLVRHENGSTFRRLIKKLVRPGPRRLQYRVEWGIYDAALFGTPQARRRIFIFCIRHGSGAESLPEDSPDLRLLYAILRHGGEIPEELKVFARRLADPNDQSMTTCLQALCDLPRLGPGQPEIPRPYATKPTSVYQQFARQKAPRLLTNTRTPMVRSETVQRLKMIPAGGCARDVPVEKLNGLSRRYDSAYRRMHPDAPSTALSTKYDCVYHFQEHRSLSVREYARLQGIPDRFSFPESIACRRHSYEMIGNSVPPVLVSGVLSQMLDKRK